MRWMLSLMLVGLLCSMLQAIEVESGAHAYKMGDAEYEGFIAKPKGATDAPAILIVHDWKGYSNFTKQRAMELAAIGYVAFAVDLYGKGKTAQDNAGAQALVKPFRENHALYKERMKGVFDELLKQPGVNPRKIGVMGFCFGGTASLELARSGAEVAAVISFHGGLKTPTPDEGKNIKGKVLVLHGNLDPHVPPEEVAAFMKEMNDGKVFYRFVGYPNSVHAFTNPEAGNDLSKGAAYNAEVAAQSFQEMKLFFNAAFK